MITLAHKTEGVNRTKNMRFYLSSFTGKERDEETGYGYFGTRYMDHDLMTMWLSVDPLADKYPNISPYAYCHWNPIKLVDPNGEDVYRLDVSNGSLKLYQKTRDKTDKIIAGSYEGIGRAKNFKETGVFSFSKGILDGAKGKDYSKTGFVSTGGNQEEAIDVAIFISYNAHVEVSGAGFTSIKNVEDAEIFGWSENSLTISNNPGEYSAPDGCATNFHFHIHPENEKADGRFGRGIPSKNDYLHAQKTHSSYGEDNFYIISSKHGVTRYNHLGVLPKALGVPKSLIKHQ